MGNLDPLLSDFTKKEIVDTLKEIRHPFEVAVYGSGNEFNFGAIIRTSHNYLASKLWGIDINWFYKKSAMCALKFEHEAIERVSLDQFLDLNKNRNIVCFERRSTLQTQDLRCFKYPDNPILLFGSEKFGCPQEILDVSHSIVSIPVFGLVNDYNVAVSAGIAMYDWAAKYYVR